MARRRSRKRDESPVVGLIAAPWQVSVVLAVVIFAIMKWVIPMQFKSGPFLPLANITSGLAPIVSLFFIAIGGISFIRNRHSAAPVLILDPFEKIHPIPESGFHISQTNTDSRSYAKDCVAKQNITDWSLDLLRSLEWKRFEMLCAEYFTVLGKRVDTIPHGADGGLDARVYNKNSDVMEFAIQCKAWDSMVGIKPVRELFGVMAHESAGKGIFMTTSKFSSDAKQFAEEHKDKLFLIDGEKLLSMLLILPEEKRRELLALSTEGDYTTPSCPSCGIKMVRRTGNNSEFWGCRNFPKCRSKLKIAA